MGYNGNLENKLRAQKLRSEGYSYSEIQSVLDVPKSTLSGWCRDIALTEDQALRLFRYKLKGSAKGRIIGAKRQQEKRAKQTKELFGLGKGEVGVLTKREKFIAGICLYSAEGTKTDKQCAFANSDPRLIKFMSEWFRDFCEVPESRLRGAIWIHEGLDIDASIKYWSEISGISKTQFYKTYVTSNKVDSKKPRKNIHKYGVFSIRFSDAKVHRKLMGWIAGVLEY